MPSTSTTTMLAVVKPEAAPGAEIREVKIPSYGRTDVLCKVKVASICGTDLHIFEWDRWAQGRIHPPLIPGHEFCGEVVAFGDEVTSVKEGDFVSAEMHVACGKCLQCRTGEAHICQNVKIIGVDTNGAFAEYVVIPESNIWKLDPAIPQEYASILDPLGNAVHTVLAGEIAAKTVAITGCGPIGLFSIAVARAVGATTIFAIEVNEHRRKLAEKMNADYALDPSKEDVRAIVAEKTGGFGVDVVLEMAGRPGFDPPRVRHRAARRTHLASWPHLKTHPAQLLRRHYFQRPDYSRHQRAPHVPDLVPDDRLAEGRTPRSSSCHYRPYRDEGFFQGHGPPENRRSQQDTRLSKRNEIAVAIHSRLPRTFSRTFSRTPETVVKL